MKIIDTHTHLFNLRYLPVEGILKNNPNFSRLPSWAAGPLAKFVVASTVKDKTLDTADKKNKSRVNKNSKKSVTDIFEPNSLNYFEKISEIIPPNTINTKQVETALKNGYKAGLIENMSKSTDEEKIRAIFKIAEHGGFDLKLGMRWLKSIAVARERDILDSLTSTYKEIDTFVHHMMDMDNFYSGPSPSYRFHGGKTNQINRMKNLEGHNPKKKIITFVAWDPFRADGLAIVKDAINNYGARGVKVYPPSGYRPIGNSNSNPFRHPKSPDAHLINKRNIELYKWCVKKDIPIFTHCTPIGFQAFNGAGVNCDPKYWRDVLNESGLRKLTLAFGHAGGEAWFERSDLYFNTSYAREVFEICSDKKFPNTFCEFGILDSIKNTADEKTMRERIHSLIVENPRFGDSIMYGSDWHMLYMFSEHANFLKNYLKMFSSKKLEKHKEGFFHKNAEKFLGI